MGALEALGILPSAALVPGGVRAEIAAGALVGAALGTLGLPLRLRPLPRKPRAPG